MDTNLELFQCPYLSEQLDCIEHKSRSSLLNDGCLWTAMDVNSDVIAIGTNGGILIVYDRQLNCVINRLTSKISKSAICCIKIFYQNELLIAFGNSLGQIIIIHYVSFQSNTKDRLQAFTLKGLHEDKITTIEWSYNGLTLFSGDKKGNIMQTDLDLYKNTSKSILLHKEESSIVQLSYYDSFLLISTLHRSALYNLLDIRDIKQIGTLPRKKLGKYGAIFIKKNKDVSIYASRQGLRLWKANYLDGSVDLTHQLKDQSYLYNNNIYVLKYKSFKEPFYEKIEEVDISNLNLGQLKRLDDNYIISFADKCFIIINILKGCIEMFYNLLPSDILSMSIVDKEIFILLHWKDKDDHFPIVKFSNKKSSLDHINKKISIKNITQKAGLVKNELSNTLKNFGDGFKNVQEAAKDTIINKFQAGKNEIQELLESKRNNFDLEGKLASIILGRNLVYSNDVILIQEDNIDLTDSSINEDIYTNTNSKIHEKMALIDDKKEHSISDIPNISIATHLKPKNHKGKRKKSNNKLKDIDSFSDNSSVHSISQASITNESTDSISAILEPIDLIISPPSMPYTIDLALLQSDAPLTTSALLAPLLVPLQQAQFDHNLNNFSRPNILMDSLIMEECTETIIESNINSKFDLISDYNSGKIPSNSYNISVNSKNNDSKLIYDINDKTLPCNNNNNDKSITYNIISPYLFIKDDSIINFNEIKNEDNLYLVNDINKSNEYLNLIKLDLDDSENLNLNLKSASNINVCNDNYSQSDDSNNKVNITLENTCKEISIDEQLENNINDMNLFVTNTTAINSFGSKTISDINILQDNNKQININNNVDSHLEIPQSNEISLEKQIEINIYDMNSLESKVDLIETNIYDMNSLESNNNSEVIKGATNFINKNLESNLLFGNNYSDAKLSIKCTDQPIKNNFLSKLWYEYFTPSSHLTSLSGTSNILCCTDSNKQIFTTNLQDSKFFWKLADGKADKICLSSNGDIMWRIFNGNLFAAEGLIPNSSIFLKWVEFAKDVINFHLDRNIGCYLKKTGQIYYQLGLSNLRPCTKSVLLKYSKAFSYVKVTNEIIWVLSDDKKLFASSFKSLNHNQLVLKDVNLSTLGTVLNFDLSSEGVAFIFDENLQLWIVRNISHECPTGDAIYWNILLPSYTNRLFDITGDKNISKNNYLKNTIITVNKFGGFWIYPHYGNILFYSGLNIIGHLYEKIISSDKSSLENEYSFKQLSVFTNTSTYKCYLWLIQSNSLRFICYDLNSKSFIPVPPPIASDPCVCISAGELSAWCVCQSGQVFVRSCVSQTTPLGVRWDKLDLIQLGKHKIKHVSIGNGVVWSVDMQGSVYMRIGINQRPFGHALNPAWLIVSEFEGTNANSICFRRISVAPNDLHVWAIDIKGCVYVRLGISENYPIGDSWKQIKTENKIKCISNSNCIVCVVTVDGKLKCRNNISVQLPEGNQWIDMPGKDFANVSIDCYNNIWLLDTCGNLLRHKFISHFDSKISSSNCLEVSDGKDTEGEEGEDDWILINK